MKQPYSYNPKERSAMYVASFDCKPDFRLHLESAMNMWPWPVLIVEVGSRFATYFLDVFTDMYSAVVNEKRVYVNEDLRVDPIEGRVSFPRLDIHVEVSGDELERVLANVNGFVLALSSTETKSIKELKQTHAEEKTELLELVAKLSAKIVDLES